VTAVAKKLYLLQINYGGIPEEAYHFLPRAEREMLVERKGAFFLKPEHRKKLKVVLTGGVFDVLHIGHIVTLAEAKTHGNVLVVAVARDHHIRKKGREPVHPLEYRQMMVEALKPVDAALAGFDSPARMLKLVEPDVIVYGYDQPEFMKPGGVEIVRLEKRINDRKFKTAKIMEILGL
jgi:cytidyltransferase-like protein